MPRSRSSPQSPPRRQRPESPAAACRFDRLNGFPNQYVSAKLTTESPQPSSPPTHPAPRASGSPYRTSASVSAKQTYRKELQPNSPRSRDDHCEQHPVGQPYRGTPSDCRESAIPSQEKSSSAGNVTASSRHRIPSAACSDWHLNGHGRARGAKPLLVSVSHRYQYQRITAKSNNNSAQS